MLLDFQNREPVVNSLVADDRRRHRKQINHLIELDVMYASWPCSRSEIKPLGKEFGKTIGDKQTDVPLPSLRCNPLSLPRSGIVDGFPASSLGTVDLCFN